MLDFNTFIFIAVAAAFLMVGIVVWVADSGVSDKYKSFLALFVLTLMASIFGLFFVIDDNSEFEYSGYEQMEGKGGGGKRRSMMEDSGKDGGTDVGEDLGNSKGGTEITKACDVCPVMMLISPGMAILGSTHKISSGGLTSGPTAQKNFKNTFAIGKFEVTVGEFQAFVDETKYSPKGQCRRSFGDQSKAITYLQPGFPQSSRHPVVCLNWIDATKYAAWLSTKSEKTFRLPTEAEWEFAARAGITAQPYMTGEKLSPRIANFRPRKGVGKQSTLEVGSYYTNGNGLYDIHGNVWEMVSDCWLPYYQVTKVNTAKPPKGMDCSRRIVKGGGWASPVKQSGFAMRGAIPVKMAVDGVGFRVMHE